MPDDELIGLAERGELRQNLDAQVKRMLKDGRSRALVQNFVGQWLQVRDVEGISINDQAVLAREDDELRKLLDGIQKAKTDFDRRVFFRQLRFRPKAAELNGDIRKAMQQEAEMLFGYILREDRSVLDLIDCNYTFVNEKLAKHYGLPAVTGSEMRRVELPERQPARRRADAGLGVGRHFESRSHVAGQARPVYFGKYPGLAPAAAAGECAAAGGVGKGIPRPRADGARDSGSAPQRSRCAVRAIRGWIRWDWASRTLMPWECGAKRSAASRSMPKAS